MSEVVDAEWIIARFGLVELPVESTRFVRTYTSAALAADGTAAGSAIIGLLSREPSSRSLFHRVACDEMWHHYAGGGFRLIRLHPDGTDDEVVIGSDLVRGQVPQAWVPAGVWQAAALLDDTDWALFGCTVTPEFTPSAFEGGHVSTLLRSHPGRASDIRRLGVPDGADRLLPSQG